MTKLHVHNHSHLPTSKVANSDSAIYLSDRQDQETIRKVNQLEIPTLFPSSSSSLIGRIEKGAPRIASTPSPKEKLLSMNPETLREIDAELGVPPVDVNYMIRLQEVIGKLLAQFIRIADKDRAQKDEQKKKYNEATTQWGNLQKEVGDRGFNFTWIALGLMASQFALPQADREIVSFLSREGCNNLSNMFNTESQSKQKQVDALGQLAYAEISAMMNKGSSDSNKQELINLLDKLTESMKRAAQAG